MSWSGLQREALEAMGFAVLVPHPAPGGAERIAAAADTSARASAARPAPPEPVVGPPAALASAANPPRIEPRIEPRPAPSAQDRLARALLRAAGRAPDAADALALLAQWPDPARLRRDPAAKRALWPRLRALRRADA